MNNFVINIEKQYISWSQSAEKTKEINFQIDSVDLKIIFNRGRWLYPIALCPSHKPDKIFVKNTVNIASANNVKIKELFENNLIKEIYYKEESYYSFSTNPNENDKFKMRFFLNESLIKEKLLEEEKEYDQYEFPTEMDPRHIVGGDGECILS